MSETTIGFIGFGLIGGSIARALKTLHPNYNLIAFNYYKNKTNANLDLALADHTLDRIVTDLADGFHQCDIIFLCAPVLMNIEYMKQLKPIIKHTCIITDVGSVKGNIAAAATELKLEENFIGGHPMAGSDRTGYSNSSANLLVNAFYILTPTVKTPNHMLAKMKHMVEEIGAIPIVLESTQHDDITAAISHVPHIIAASLVNMIRTQENDSDLMRSLAAGGFKDITRIASSSPVMWQNICLTNTESILTFLDIYKNSLDKLMEAIKAKNETEIIHLFEQAKDFRDSIPNKSVGMIEKVFELYLDIVDEAGTLAAVATILATNSISIKNIGIIHNREFQDGVLRIELYNEYASQKAVDLLHQYHYTIYER